MIKSSILMVLILFTASLYAIQKTDVLLAVNKSDVNTFNLILKGGDTPIISQPSINKILFRFNNQIVINEDELKKLPNDINVNYGYDSFQITTLKTYKLAVNKIEDSPLMYSIKQKNADPKVKTTQSKELLIAKLRRAQNDNDFSEGSKIVTILEDNYMDDPNVILAIAQYAFDIGQYRKTIRYLNELDQKFPNYHQDDVLWAALYQRREWFVMEELIVPENASELNYPFLIYKDNDTHNDRFKLDFIPVYISPSPEVTEISTTADLTYAVTDNNYVGAVLQNILYNDPSLQNPNTGQTESEFASRFNGELYFQHFFLNEDILQFSLYAGYQSLLGGGARYSFWIPKGNIAANLDVNKPVTLDQLDFGYGVIPVTIVYGGTTDQAYLDGGYNITNNLLWLYNVGAAQYSIHGFNNAASSVNAFTSFSYYLNGGIDALRFLNTYGQYFITYSYNAQYMLNVDSATGTTGNTYNPIPLFTYEIQTLQFSWQDLFYHQRLQPMLYVGVSYNRYGANIGAIFGGELTYIFDDSHSITLFASRGISTQVEDAFNDIAGLRFAWYF